MAKKFLIIGSAAVIALATSAFAYNYYWMNEPVEFYAGHTHQGGGTQGAPEHSGGTDRYGCHNASVPYHCH